jgi:chromosome partitioning protein
MRVIALANQKGGCGKTTVATNLAAALVEREQRVLLFDNDPQGHATLACGLNEGDFTLSAYDLYLTTDQRVEDVRCELRPGFDLVPAGIELSAVEQALAGERDRDSRLRRALSRSAMPYDVVVIDCPPSVGLLTFNALLACGEVVVPVDPSPQTLQAARKFRETLGVIRERRGRAAAARFLLSDYDPRTRFARAMAETLAHEQGEAVLETVIHHTVRLKEAAASGRPVVFADPGSRGALDFGMLAAELLAKPAPDLAAEPERAEAPLGPRPAATGVSFTARFPRARAVHITGTFNGWNAEGDPLTQRADGVWEAVLAVPPGQHEYRFIVDGAWVTDPGNAASVPNVFGGENSLLLVP